MSTRWKFIDSEWACM
uniref:Uncharacterized protein n=1 Tax=Arundo donax TaxID=35708 RepID=A0A0A9HT20_ARUDO